VGKVSGGGGGPGWWKGITQIQAKKSQGRKTHRGEAMRVFPQCPGAHIVPLVHPKGDCCLYGEWDNKRERGAL